MSIVRLLMLVLAAAAAMTFTSCDNVPTGPGSGSGNLLRATIDGTTYTFTLDETQSRYDAQATYSYVFGLNGVSPTTKTLVLTFVDNLDAGTYPRTLASADVNVILIDRVNGAETTYDAMVHNTERSMTLTRNSDGIVDGTFSGTLANRLDASRRVTVSGGEFSVQLR